MTTSPFHTWFAVRDGRNFRGPAAFPRLRWMLFVRRCEQARTGWALDRLFREDVKMTEGTFDTLCDKSSPGPKLDPEAVWKAVVQQCRGGHSTAAVEEIADPDAAGEP